MSKLGLVVNPIAGMGGRVGLKGTDGEEILERARELGAIPVSPARAVEALLIVKELCGDLEVITYPGEMGEDAARACGFAPTVVGLITPGATTSQDTKDAAREMQRLGTDLLLFAGGDGTARDVYLSRLRHSAALTDLRRVVAEWRWRADSWRHGALAEGLKRRKLEAIDGSGAVRKRGGAGVAIDTDSAACRQQEFHGRQLISIL